MRATIIAALAAGLGTACLVGPAAAVPAGPNAGIAPAHEMLTQVRMKRMRKSRRMRSTATPGAPAGGPGGNNATGSGAAPSGK